MKRIIYIISIAVCSFSLFAQTGSNGNSFARELALGNSFTTASKGLNAIGFNPANLALKNNHTIEISTVLPVPNVSIYAGSEVMSIKDYNYYFGGTGELDSEGKKKGRVLTDVDKQNLIDLFANGDLVNSDVSLNLFSIAYHSNSTFGSLAFALKDRFANSSSVDQELIKFMMLGNKNNPNYSIQNMNFHASYTREYSLTYAKDLSSSFQGLFKAVYAGVSAKYLQGFAYAELLENDFAINTLANGELEVKGKILLNASFSPDFGIDYDFDKRNRTSKVTPMPTPAGTGLGFDFGVTVEINNALSAGLSLTDIGSLKWDNQNVEYRMDGYKIIDDFTQKENLDSLKEIFDFKGKYIGAINSKLPTALHIGMALRVDKLESLAMTNKFLVVFDYHQGFNDVSLNSTSPRVSLGMEYEFMQWLNLRTGFSMGGKYGFRWSAGFGLDFNGFEFDLTASDFNHLVNANNAKKIGVALGTKWKF